MLPIEAHVDEVLDLGIYENTLSQASFLNRAVLNEGGFVAIEPIWTKPLSTVQIGERLINQAEHEYLRDFFLARRGRAISFLWRDYSDCRQIDVPLLVGTLGNTQLVYKVQRFYTDPFGFSLQIPCDRLIPESVEIKRNGVVVPFGTPNAQGEIVFLAAPQSGVWTISYQFLKAVRFDTDQYQARFDYFDDETRAYFFVSDLRLKEIRLTPSTHPAITLMPAARATSGKRANLTLVNKAGAETAINNCGWTGSGTSLSGPFYPPVLSVYLASDAFVVSSSPLLYGYFSCAIAVAAKSPGALPEPLQLTETLLTGTGPTLPPYAQSWTRIKSLALVDTP